MSTSGNGQEKLKIGTKNGCLTIIGGFEEFDRLQEEKAEKAIIEYTRQIEEFKSTGSIAPRRSENGGVLFSGFAMRDDPVAELEKSIEKARHWREDIYYRPRYKVQCKCGNIHYVDQFHFEKKRHRFCIQSSTTGNIMVPTRAGYVLNSMKSSGNPQDEKKEDTMIHCFPF